MHVRLSEMVTAGVLLWQSASLVNIGTPADPEHLRFERAVLVPPATAGLACAVLDPAVLAHTASAAQSDVRLYRGYPGSPAQAEVPYLLTESGPEPVADTEVRAEHVVQHGPELRFDLRMPARSYSEIDLHLSLRNFVGTVRVSAEGALAKTEQQVGTFGVYDLTDRHLGRWTVLPLAETTAPVLHLRLSLRTPEGTPFPDALATAVSGAAVPPSRERQTLFSPVVATTNIQRRTTASMAELQVPAHVPVERVRFDLAPDYQANFDREVTISARPERQDLTETEIVDAGTIEHVQIPSGDAGLRPIDVQQLWADGTVGATLASNAEVRVFVQDGAQPPLPIRRVTLEMRERRLCFLAATGATYTLRYGDAALAPPVYDTSGLLVQNLAPAVATLGPEGHNTAWQPRADTRSYLQRHPELFWIALLVCGGMMGGSALHYVQHRGAVKQS